MIPIPSVCPRNLLVSIYTPRWRGAQCKLSVLTKDNNTMTLTSTEPRELDPKFNVNTDNVRQTRSIFCTLARMDQWKISQGWRLTFQLASPVASDKFDSRANTNFSLARYSNIHHRIKSINATYFKRRPASLWVVFRRVLYKIEIQTSKAKNNN